MKTVFAYNPYLVNKPLDSLPDAVHKIMWRRINSQFVNTRQTPQELANIISQGHAYTACHINYRHQRNFVQGQILSLDFDENGDFSLLQKDEFISRYAYMMYSTPSSTKSNPRSRVLFILPEPVKSAELFSLMSRALVDHYGQADASCKDPARIFYGSKDCDILFLNNIMPANIAIEMAAKVKEGDDIKREAKSSAVSTNCISSRTLNDYLRPQLDKIINAPHGSKHAVRMSVATLVGGYVSGGYMSYTDALEHLLSAAFTNTSKPHLAEQDILDGLRYGLQSPVSLSPQRFEDFGIHIEI